MKFLSIFVLLIVTLLSATSVVQSQIGTYPNGGFYLGLGSNFLSKIGSELTTNINAQLNSYPIADMSGDDGGIKYDITSIKQSVSLSQFYYEQNDVNTYSIGFDNVQFTIKTNYKVCKHVGDQDADLCEHGDITIASTVAGIKIWSIMNLDFNQSPAILSSQSVGTFLPNANAISYSAHCTSRVCDHTHDISNKIASQFVQDVTSAANIQINANCDKYKSLIPSLENLNFAYGGNDFFLDTSGRLVESNTDKSSITPTMTLALNGGVVVKKSNGQYVYPTKQPTSTPSASTLEGFTSDVSLVLTPYLFETLVDGVLNCALPMTIDQLPSESPVQLNTSDPFFSQIAPGLAAEYPDLAITVLLDTPNIEAVFINSSGITLYNTSLVASFMVDINGTKTQVFGVEFSINVDLDAQFTQIGQAINISTTIKSLDASAFIQNTIVGSVDTDGFIQLIQLMQSVVSIPPMAINNPSKTYTITYTNTFYGDQLIQLDFNIDNAETNKIKIN
ncbi:hypothetical protein CYY_005077 [Polysphondylium violaceum]|uniref:Lipid-binding serum glycoprotein C-terminal domain-containing protein n=1 Tax=Polysphondylium violaceum TaxID=133409 RepID=A0A8J4UYU8_9MYCE|nr:hypothetical protein CYY_005077 [Polysphondylium violaceum]